MASANSTFSSLVVSTATSAFSHTQHHAPSQTQAAGAASSSDSGNPNGINSSASLYLYTFLATLVLLLGVSAAIVFRSLILRRRHRAMIEEAIRNGTWIPPASGRGVKIDPSQKPDMYEAHFLDEKSGLPGEHGEWEVLTPFSVSYTIPHTQRVQRLQPTAPSAPTTTAPISRPLPERVRGGFRQAWSHFSSSPTTPEPSVITEEERKPPPLPDSTSGPLRISILIAMPSQQKHHRTEDEELPHVEVGVAHVVVSDEDGSNGKAAGSRSMESTSTSV